MKKWWYNWRFIFAYRTLRNVKERHRALGHEVKFHAMNDFDIYIVCMTCTEDEQV